MTPDPLTPLGLEQLAELGGKKYNTAWAWWSRTQAGTARDPLPTKDGGTDKHPLWLFRTVEPVLLRAGWVTAESRPQDHLDLDAIRHRLAAVQGVPDDHTMWWQIGTHDAPALVAEVERLRRRLAATEQP